MLGSAGPREGAVAGEQEREGVLSAGERAERRNGDVGPAADGVAP